ncbi:coiled-coil domain-containing protein 83 [Ambystoma mexicanum]|uniref:coiled-coil domain-containing protein 83 n=1 Tax=Ambystoma mexicanum TaxID=8296 RepID=UPI0037E7E462
MGKKDKKEKTGTTKEAEGKKDKNGKKMTFSEALLAFQIHIKEAAIDEYLLELKDVEEKNRRFKERNERLKAEQLVYIRDLLDEAKKQDKELSKKEVVNREQVDQAIKEKWEYIKTMESNFEEKHTRINQLAQDTVEKEFERDYWLAYKNVGSAEHAKQIELLEMELVNIQQNLKEIEEHFRKSLETTKNKINLEVAKQIEEKKELATESAVKRIDKFSRKELKENSWLKSEVEVYRKELGDLETDVRNIEQENLKLLSELFDCRLQDLKISRNCFLTQVAGLDIPADSLLGEDLLALEWIEEPVHAKAAQKRPKSAKLLAVQKKLLSVEEKLRGRKTEQETCKWDPASDFCLSEQITNVLYGDEQDFQAYLQLGSLELKLLSIVGQKMSIHKDTKNKPTKGSLHDVYDDTHAKWPITHEKITSTLS